MSELSESLKQLAATAEVFSGRAVTALRQAAHVVETLEAEHGRIAEICIDICHNQAADGANEAAKEIGRRFGIKS